ncbi:hypothetical protein [Pseudobdellovibrio sp. HCB154]|uniref:hypothetical protein n=1 Tax=Pseudobdellovibrio sp. HCB154 TaxID=3386277 RepID=UPI0039171655
MNKLIAIIALFAAATASAYTAATPWETLENDPRIQIDAPTVFMGHAVDYMFTCKDGNNLRTIKPVKQCETIYIGKNQSKEVCKGEKYLSTPINYTRTSWDCNYVGGGQNSRRECEDKVISGTYPLTVMVKVSKVMGGKNDRVEFLFNKAFTVQNCH